MKKNIIKHTLSTEEQNQLREAELDAATGGCGFDLGLINGIPDPSRDGPSLNDAPFDPGLINGIPAQPKY